MRKEDLIFIASVAVVKDMSYEDLMNSAYLDGNKHELDNIWEYVVECKDDGVDTFQERYEQYKMCF